MNNDSVTGEVNKNKRNPLAVCLWMTLCVLAASLGLTFGFFIFGTVLITMAAALFALLIVMRAPSPYYIACPLSVAAASVIPQLAGKDFSVSIILLSFIAAGGAVAICVTKKGTRTGTVIAAAACFGLFLLALGIYSYLSAGNEFSAKAIREYLASQVDSAKALARNFADEYIKNTPYYKSALESEAISDETLYEYIDALVSATALASPGIIIAALQVAGYICTCWFSLFVRAARCEIVMPSPRWELYPTNITIAVFIISYMLYTITYMLSLFANTGGIVGTVAFNIVLVTMPVMFALGCGTLFRRKTTRYRRPLGGFVLIFIVLLFLSPLLAFSIISLVGALGVLAKRKAEAAEDKSGDDNDKNNGMF